MLLRSSQVEEVLAQVRELSAAGITAWAPASRREGLSELLRQQPQAGAVLSKRPWRDVDGPPHPE